MSRKTTASKKPAAKAKSHDHHDPGGTARKAAGVEPDLKASNLTRLRRAEGQVRGISRMVEEDRYCADVITQIAAAQESLRAVAKALLKNHLKHCATAALKRGATDAEEMYDELLDMMSKMAR